MTAVERWLRQTILREPERLPHWIDFFAKYSNVVVVIGEALSRLTAEGGPLADKAHSLREMLSQRRRAPIGGLVTLPHGDPLCAHSLSRQ